MEQCVQPTVRPRTYDSYEWLVRIHLKPGLGHIQLAKLNPQHVQTFLNDCLAKQRLGTCEQDSRPSAENPKTLSPRTVQYLRAVLRRALGQALKWSLVSRNVATLVDSPRSKRPQVTSLTPDEARTLLTSIQGDRLEVLFSAALALGLRQGEALGLRWDDIDFDTATLRVNFALQKISHEWKLVEPKTERSRRTLKVPPSLLTKLRSQRSRQLEERMAAGEGWSNDLNLVFTTLNGGPLDARNVLRCFQRALTKAGLGHFRFHDLRHSCASLLLAQNVGVRTIMEVLGHSAINLTMDTYAHVMPSMLSDAADQMEQVLTKKK